MWKDPINFFKYILILSVIFPLSLFAKEKKIGYINMKALFDEAAVTKKISKSYDREKREIIESREFLKEEINRAIHDLKIERGYLKKKDFAAPVKEIQKKIDELNDVIREVNEQLEALENEMKLEIFLDISEAIDGVARDQGFDLILNKKNAVIFADDDMDITDDVLDILTEINERDHPNVK